MGLLSCECEVSGGGWGYDRSSDELLAREELRELLAALALVLDDRAGGARRTLGGGVHSGPGTDEADLVGVDLEVLQVQGLHRLLLGGHDALEGRVAGLARLVRHGH